MVFLSSKKVYDSISLGIIALPIDPSTRGERHRCRVLSQGLLLVEVEVELKVRQDQLACCAKYGVSIAEPREIRLGNSSPAPLPPKTAKNVIIITNGAEID
jgi:hypothetical protein